MTTIEGPGPGEEYSGILKLLQIEIPASEASSAVAMAHDRQKYVSEIVSAGLMTHQRLQPHLSNQDYAFMELAAGGVKGILSP